MRTKINGRTVDTWNDEDKLICPHCGAVMEVDFETFEGKDPDTSQDMECPDCGRTFTATRHMSFHYETYKNNPDGTTNWDNDTDE